MFMVVKANLAGLAAACSNCRFLGNAAQFIVQNAKPYKDLVLPGDKVQTITNEISRENA